MAQNQRTHRRDEQQALGTGVAAAAVMLKSYLQEDREDAALRVIWQLATDLRRALPEERSSLCAMPPESTGSDRYDALIAAVVDHLLDDLARPAWLDEPWRTLGEPWDVEPVAELRDAARAVTPARVAAHGIYLDPDELIDR